MSTVGAQHKAFVSRQAPYPNCSKRSPYFTSMLYEHSREPNAVEEQERELEDTMQPSGTLEKAIWRW